MLGSTRANSALGRSVHRPALGRRVAAGGLRRLRASGFGGLLDLCSRRWL
jgi:hypothetical protein